MKQTLLEDPSGTSLKKLKAELDKAGCDLIMTKVEEEKMLVNLFEFNIDFGQGFLFGVPQLAPVHG